MMVRFLVVLNGQAQKVGEDQINARAGISALQEAGRVYFSKYREDFEEKYGKGLSFQAQWLELEEIVKTVWINV